MKDVKVKLLKPGAKMPVYGTEFSAGADLCACLEQPVTLEPGETRLISIGISMEIPVGYAGFVFARSGLATKRHLAPANKVGVIDSDYRGEFFVPLRNHGPIPQTIEPGERIALIGDNGTGKSTLLKCITGEELPDKGYMHTGPAVKSAYLPQLVRFEDPSRNMVDTMLWEARCDTQTARNRLAAFGFRGEDVFKTVAVLSGGEQSRLRLCILMRDDINFLILDEPTNHLDLISREWMEDAISDYGEALLFVSHDRWFIEKFATRIWCLKDGKVEDFKGGWQAWREYQQRQAVYEQTARTVEKKKDPKPKKKAEPNRERRIQKLEKEIEKAEGRVAAIEAEMAENAADYQKLLELGEAKAAADAELEALYEQWEELAE